VPPSFNAGAEPSVRDWAAAVERVACELHDLLPAAEARAVSAELTPLLTRMRESGSLSEEILDEIAELLTAHGPTRHRLNRLLGPAQTVHRYPGYAGDTLVGYDRYICPDCERAWIILDADEDEQPPEHCPDDGAALTFVIGT
jgi:hypothetical protein